MMIAPFADIMIESRTPDHGKAQEICSDPYYIVKGVVVDGVREGAKYVSLYSYIIRNVLGLEPYPGTLNIKLPNELLQFIKRLLHKCVPFYIIPPPGRNLGGAFSWRAYLRFKERCVFVYVVKPEKTIHGEDVIEVISDKYLRGELGIKTGDVVEVIFIRDNIVPSICL